MSGPSDTPDAAPKAAVPAPQPQEPAPENRLVPGGRQAPPASPVRRVPDEGQGAGAAMAAMMSGTPLPKGPDPRTLRTNRGDAAAKPNQPSKATETIGRNDPCPCGSGKKYKKCHGAGAA